MFKIPTDIVLKFAKIYINENGPRNAPNSPGQLFFQGDQGLNVALVVENEFRTLKTQKFCFSLCIFSSMATDQAVSQVHFHMEILYKPIVLWFPHRYRRNLLVLLKVPNGNPAKTLEKSSTSASAIVLDPVHTYVFSNATFLFRIRLSSTRIR